MTTQSGLRIAIDIGGTFTDTVLVDRDGVILATAKTPTTPDSPTTGALEGAIDAVNHAKVSMENITGFIHGTTLATNALIERRGARVAGVTTAGFRDILEIAYERRYSQYDINLEKPDLLVPRERCFTVGERMSSSGKVLTQLDEADVDRLADDLGTSGADAVAICLLHSYANSSHEERLRELLLERLPDLTVSISSEVSPEAREFDRLCTTIANACIQPLMSAYLGEFAKAFNTQGIACPILLMTAGGGMTTIETAAKFPIRLVESGPAGGAILAAKVASDCGMDRVLSFDMGGTTAKLCLIDDYQPQTSRQFEISRAERFIKGSGMPVRIPVVEMIEIGAGGGSIASVDRLGRISVGPQSAGSIPGPAAFGRGGKDATVTDADVVLGLVDPAQFAEGRLPIDTAAAQIALEDSVGKPLELNGIEAALGVAEIVDESMASAARMHAVESGKDLGERTMIAFGGNGPLHATRVARRAGIKRILVPRDPGVGSAVGFLYAPVSYEIVRSRYARLDRIDIAQINALFDEMAAESDSVVRAGAPDRELMHKRSAFMRYHGQGHEIEVVLPDRNLTTDDIPQLVTDFEEEYSRQFSRAVPGMTIEILNWAIKTSTISKTSPPTPKRVASQKVGSKVTRSICCEVTGSTVKAAVLERATLQAGDTMYGPALIIEPQTTTYVSADFSAEVDAELNLILTRNETAEASQ